MVIELSGVQFWSEIILVISNRTRAARSFDFEITRMISDLYKLHSTQFNYHYLFKRMSISLLKKSVLPLTKMPFYTCNVRALIEKS